MLRRRLLGIFGSLVVLLAAMAVIAIWLLQGVLEDLDHVNTLLGTAVDQTSRLNSSIALVEIKLYQLQTGKERDLDRLIDETEQVGALIDAIGNHDAIHEGATKEHYLSLCRNLPRFKRSVSSLATAQDPNLARQFIVDALAAANELQGDVLQIDQRIRDQARREQSTLANRFRWVVLGMAIGGLLVINLTVIFLLRTASMVLRPVDTLVEAGRQLSDEHFDFRANLDRDDEFHEIAQAYNTLAERLQANEQRKMEMLGQVGLTLNHELNNAIATIELQLQLLERHSDGNARFVKCLQQIQENLRRMVATVESLKHIRRIVLTDYMAGVKMLDLQRSVQDEPAREPDPSETTP